MWEMIERMASDRLWIYTAIIGSLFGLAFSTLITNQQELVLWLYSKFDIIIDYLVMRWGWTWLQQRDAWRKSTLMLLRRLTNLKTE